MAKSKTAAFPDFFVASEVSDNTIPERETTKKRLTSWQHGTLDPFPPLLEPKKCRIRCTVIVSTLPPDGVVATKLLAAVCQNNHESRSTTIASIVKVECRPPIPGSLVDTLEIYAGFLGIDICAFQYLHRRVQRRWSLPGNSRKEVPNHVQSNILMIHRPSRFPGEKCITCCEQVKKHY